MVHYTYTYEIRNLTDVIRSGKREPVRSLIARDKNKLNQDLVVPDSGVASGIISAVSCDCSTQFRSPGLDSEPRQLFASEFRPTQGVIPMRRMRNEKRVTFSTQQSFEIA